MTRVYNSIWGNGDVLSLDEKNGVATVRFDSDPWWPKDVNIHEPGTRLYENRPDPMDEDDRPYISAWRYGRG